MVTRETLLAIVLTVVMITAAGCAGWGTDGPADGGDDTSDDTTDDLEEADGEAQADEGDGSSGDDSSSDGSADSSDSDSDQSDSSKSSKSGDSDSTDSDTSSDSSKSKDKTGGDSDESTDETGQTGDGDSSDSSDGTDTDDGDRDSDSDDSSDEYDDHVSEPERTLTITVVDENGEPVSGAAVHGAGPVLSNGVAHEPAGETDDDGVVTLTAYDGEYGIEVQHDGPTVNETVTVDGDTEMTITVPAQDDGDGDGDTEPNYVATGKISVVDQNGDPVADEPVTIEFEDGSTEEYQTDENGEVVLEFPKDSPDEIATVTATVRDESESLIIKTDDANGVQELTFSVEPQDEPETHTLTVTVTDPNGEPVTNEDVHVLTYDGGADVANGTTDENGQVTFDLENGTYEIGVSAPEQNLFQPSDQRLVKIDGADEEFTIELQQSGGEPDTATGVIRVVDDDGDPIEGERVTITPPGTVRESDKEQRVTDENGEVRIELAAGDPSDAVMYTAEVRGEEKTLGIMSDEHTGVQEVVFNPTDRMYHFETVIQVVDENGEPVEGVEVEARHGMLGDDPANEWEVVGETDGSGEVVLTGGSSEPTDVIAQEVRVRDQTITTYLEYERQVEQIEIETGEDEKQNVENGQELVAV